MLFKFIGRRKVFQQWGGLVLGSMACLVSPRVAASAVPRIPLSLRNVPADVQSTTGYHLAH